MLRKQTLHDICSLWFHCYGSEISSKITRMIPIVDSKYVPGIRIEDVKGKEEDK